MRHARIMDISTEYTAYGSELETSHIRCLGSHRLIVDGFKNYLSDRFVLQCPTGRRSREAMRVVILLSDMTLLRIFEKYVDSIKDLRDAVDGMMEKKISTAPLTFSVFTRYFTKRNRELEVAKIGLDFFHFSTSLKSDLCQLDKEDARYEARNYSLNGHQDNAMREHEYYLRFLEDAAEIRDGNVQHLAFDFAKNVLLLRLVRQPGQLYSKNGLKINLIGVHDSKSE